MRKYIITCGQFLSFCFFVKAQTWNDDMITARQIVDSLKKELIVVSRTLKEIEELLEEHSFIRVHRCYLANLNEVEKYVKGEGRYLLMSDGTTIDVARNKKEVLLKKLLPYKE